MLESEEAARRLGVKLSTLYAYVSRGLLPSHRTPDSRRSLFDAGDVEALARRARGGRSTESRLATVTTAVTQLGPAGPVYRGTPAVDLATTVPYEEAAELLWQADPPSPLGWRSAPLATPPPTALGASDRLRWAVLMAGSADPLRSDLRPQSVVAAARRLVATMVSVLARPEHPRPPPVAGAAPRGPDEEFALELAGRAPQPGTLARALTARLSPAPSTALVRAVNAALILLADHELATSTVAVRVAASTRADLYDATMAGLAVVAGPLHGGASQLAHTLLRDAERLGPERALDDTLRWQRHLPGFGHTVYQEADPRGIVLRELVEPLASPEQRRVLEAVLALAAQRSVPGPNIDLALAALTIAGAMPEDAGRTIFAVARVAGWTAHYLEELGERPLRYRARAVYAARP